MRIYNQLSLLTTESTKVQQKVHQHHKIHSKGYPSIWLWLFQTEQGIVGKGIANTKGQCQKIPVDKNYLNSPYFRNGRQNQ